MLSRGARRALTTSVVYTHRWLGIVGCLLFLAWFLSGIVLMYARMPSLSAEERLARVPALAVDRIQVAPADAVHASSLTDVRSIRLGMSGERPVYRLAAGRMTAMVFADTGAPADRLDVTSARAVVAPFAARAAQLAADTPVRRLDSPDQWTLSSALPGYFPLYRVPLNDSAGTEIYVSAITAEPILKTTRSGRTWGYLGAVLHWLYFTPLRRHSELWTNVVIYTSLAGCVMCLSGLAWGAWRLSPFGRYRLRRHPSHTPYAGMMRWHHYAGLLFGLTTFTWMLSGLLSMTPWDWNAGTSPSRPQREGAAGGTYSLAGISADGLRMALRTLSAAFVIKEIEVLQVDGERFYRAYRTPERDQAGLWTNTDLEGYLTPQTTLEERLLSVDQPSAPPFRAFDRARIERAAQAAMPGVVFESLVWLKEFDNYYYGRSGSRPLPVLRARFRDAEATALYLDPRSGEIVRREDRRTRIERWLYHGLHSLDVAWLYRRRPLWDIVVVGLSAGGLVLCASSAAHAWHRLRRHARRMWPSRTDV